MAKKKIPSLLLPGIDPGRRAPSIVTILTERIIYGELERGRRKRSWLISRHYSGIRQMGRKEKNIEYPIPVGIRNAYVWNASKTRYHSVHDWFL